MSNKIKVRFNYGGQNTVLINQAQKGPTDLTNLANNAVLSAKQQVSTATYKQLQPAAKEQILIDNLHQIAENAQKTVDAVESKQTEIVKNSKLNTYKSQQFLPNIEPESPSVKVSKKSTFKIQDLDETVFNKNPEKPIDKPIEKQLNKFDNTPAIGAPNFKSAGKQGGKPVKEYTKVENTANYQYTNIPLKDEDQFAGCFGCMRRKPKTYSIQKR